MKKTYHHLRDEERFCIQVLYSVGTLVRKIAEVLGRSPNTVSREISRNSVNGTYEAKKAVQKSSAKRWRAKKQCLKVALDPFLCRFVIERLAKPYRWSPQQISGYLERELGIICSAKAIYKFAESRGLGHLLFWGWNNIRGGRKREHWKTKKDGRKYIEERPHREGVGHIELDFIVSKESTWVLMVAVDWKAKRTWVRKLPNRKRDTIRTALSSMFHGVTLQSITTDNDIAFTCWRELEVLLQVPIYFTHPYHFWERGTNENTNGLLRQYFPKSYDFNLITSMELAQIVRRLNNRERKRLKFKTPQSQFFKS